MFTSGKKFQKTAKTKFKKNREAEDNQKHNNKKHHDKTTWRLARNEEKEYGL
jgi:hypothetical protein